MVVNRWAYVIVSTMIQQCMTAAATILDQSSPQVSELYKSGDTCFLQLNPVVTRCDAFCHHR